MVEPALVGDVEDLDSFRHRLRGWLEENMPPAGAKERPNMQSDEAELAEVAEARRLQRLLYDAGFAGIVFPKEYGGAGLTSAHQDVLNEEIVGYKYPQRLQVPGMTPCAAVLLEFGNEAQKREHLPKILSGEEIWMQMVSEPGGGSDVAGLLTSAKRDGDEWIINGSKIWTSGAWFSDWALCLARTNWDVPKHDGLTVFMLKIHQPGIEVQRIEMLDGGRDFCQEFFTDLRIPDSDRIGEVDAGWKIGTRWMSLEKSLGISPYIIRPKGYMRGHNAWGPTPLEIARRVGRLEDPVARQLVGEAHAVKVAGQEGSARIARAMASRRLGDQAAGMARIIGNLTGAKVNDLVFDLAGTSTVAWDRADKELGDRGVEQLLRQMMSISGGTIEMSRNGVSERFLGMPKEARADRDIPFRDVPRGSAGR